MIAQQVSHAGRPAVFLDRDDTLIACNELPPPPSPCAPGDLIDPALVRLLPGVLEGCIQLSQAGFTLVVVSNQGAIARGGASCEQVELVNDRVRALLTHDTEALVQAFYFCPFHPKGNVPDWTLEHPWRKPLPGMILAASEELHLDLTQSWLIGDAQRDIEAAIAAGIGSRALRVQPPFSFSDAVATILDARPHSHPR